MKLNVTESDDDNLATCLNKWPLSKIDDATKRRRLIASLTKFSIADLERMFGG